MSNILNIGDRVRVKFLDDVKHSDSLYHYGIDHSFPQSMEKYCGKYVTIKCVYDSSSNEGFCLDLRYYNIIEDGGVFIWYDDFF